MRRYRNERLGIWAGTGGHPFPLPVCRLLPPKPEEPGTRRALTAVTCLPCALPCLTASLWPSETHRVGPGLPARNPVPLKVQDARPACSVPLRAPRLHPPAGERCGPSRGKPGPPASTALGGTSGRLSLAHPPTMLRDYTTELHLPPGHVRGCLSETGKASRTSCCSSPALTRADQGAEAAGLRESIWPETSRAQSAGLCLRPQRPTAPSSFRGKQEVIKSKLSPGQVSAQPPIPARIRFPRAAGPT